MYVIDRINALKDDNNYGILFSDIAYKVVKLTVSNLVIFNLFIPGIRYNWICKSLISSGF